MGEARRWAAVTVILGVVAFAATACSVIVGLHDHSLLADDVVDAADAQINVDAHVATDAPIGDDASADATLDANSSDSATTNDSATVDAPEDALTDAMLDAGANIDANDAFIAACDASFCQCQPAHTFCSDFDNGAFPFPWAANDTSMTRDAQTLFPDDAASVSAPNSLLLNRTGFTVADGGPSTLSNTLSFPLQAPIETIEVAFDLRVDTISAQPITFFQLVLHPASNSSDSSYFLNFLVSSGQLSLYEEPYFKDGGKPTSLLTTQTIPSLIMGNQSWSSVVARIDLPNADAGSDIGGMLTVTVGTTSVVADLPIHAPAFPVNSTGDIDVSGFSSCSPTCGPAMIRFDNFTLDSF
jgi:hypothetical protein